MIQSMTGFARAEKSVAGFRVAWQVKSVNHRFLDISLRLPESQAALEPQVRQRLKNALQRGAVECRLQISRENDAEGGFAINQPLLHRLLALEERIMVATGHTDRLPLMRFVDWPGLLAGDGDPPGDETFTTGALAALDEALAALVTVRESEGAGLTQVMAELLNQLLAALDLLDTRRELVRLEVETRMRARLKELDAGPIDEARFSQEMVYFLNRLEIAEEIDRLRFHINEFRTTLARGEAVGRRLDFLCQELHREVNTIASKSQDATITRLGVDMKVAVEKLREQVQNME